ncbi:uncharacterized protein MELLADRAFT_101864 [Melampsora larici-populina 98AG31]|uniref:Uncharacterized protein n=1 Tax=Melampsora larici-populina (strain 98AG31 / pathotype 3-4-7) TaxID=747676 RepID=F4R555_MELLP|nr:uncharacterized protein MELLADRAFT_101864 [Melampsora larici-populina 98AG31]EGG12325.1 hypothetical protein MELLADRAFT_101864 [Melampsora larici-populina 98AG31]
MALKESLEAVFIDPIPGRIPRGVINLNFNNLRVVRCITCISSPSGYAWLQKPIFKNMEVLIISYWHANTYWKRLLELLQRDPITLPSKFKRIVLVNSKGQELADTEMDLANGDGDYGDKDVRYGYGRAARIKKLTFLWSNNEPSIGSICDTVAFDLLCPENRLRDNSCLVYRLMPVTTLEVPPTYKMLFVRGWR